MTRTLKRLAIATVGFAPVLALAADWDDWRYWPYSDKETIQKSFDVSKSSEAKHLLVDNMRGYIHITGATGREIRVTIHKEVRARSQSALDEGKREASIVSEVPTPLLTRLILHWFSADLSGIVSTSGLPEADVADAIVRVILGGVRIAPRT